MRRKYSSAILYLLIGFLTYCCFYYNRLVSQLEQQTESYRRSVRRAVHFGEAELSPIPPVDPVTLHRSRDVNRTLTQLDLWWNDPKCSSFDITLLDDRSIETIALVSYPGSGNSWLRMLLMAITGVYIHSVYPGDASFNSAANSTYKLSADCKCTILQKTHDFSLSGFLNLTPEENRTIELERFNRRGVLILRNPFKSIIAYKNFIAGGMTGVAPKSEFEGPGWIGFVTRSALSWQVLATVWIRGLERGGVIYYENLQDNPQVELPRLTRMIGMESIDQDRLRCALRHQNGNRFKRTNRPEYLKNPYSAKLRSVILKSIENVQNALRERGLPPLPVDKYEYYASQ